MIWWLSPEDQIAIYEHLPSDKRKKVFLGLVNPDAVAKRRDVEQFHLLKAWRESDFDGPMPFELQQ